MLLPPPMRGAGLVILLVACSGSEHAVDASATATDGAVDAFTIVDASSADAWTGTALVIVTDHQGAWEGVEVLSHGGDGELVWRGQTDASGEVLAEVSAGGWVTVASIHEVLGPRLTTIAVVAPGETLRFWPEGGDYPRPDLGAQVAAVTPAV